MKTNMKVTRELFNEQLNNTLPFDPSKEMIGSLEEQIYFNGEKYNFGDKILSAFLMIPAIETNPDLQLKSKRNNESPFDLFNYKVITLNERHFDLFEHGEIFQIKSIPTIKLRKTSKETLYLQSVKQEQISTTGEKVYVATYSNGIVDLESCYPIKDRTTSMNIPTIVVEDVALPLN